ncbi:hypothetical protein BDF19DRAFT_30211 [Syncephalis fuscata]|nr:hypothetical protein BDF19DRAFT_30211 [Syncephalis fuscata]
MDDDESSKHSTFYSGQTPDHLEDGTNTTASTHHAGELFGMSKAMLANLLSPRAALRDGRFQLELDGDITAVGRPVTLPVMDIAPYPMYNRHSTHNYSSNSTPAIPSRLEESDKSPDLKEAVDHVQVPIRKVVGRQALGLPDVAEKRSSDLAPLAMPPSSSKSCEDIDLSRRMSRSKLTDNEEPKKKTIGAGLSIDTKKDTIAMPHVKLRRRSSAGTQPLDMTKLNSGSTTGNSGNANSSSGTVLGPLSQLSAEMMQPADKSTWSAPIEASGTKLKHLQLHHHQLLRCH